MVKNGKSIKQNRMSYMIMAFCSQAIVLNLVEHDKFEKIRALPIDVFGENHFFYLFGPGLTHSYRLKSSFVNLL